MWTEENRVHYDRSRSRYPSDLADDEWAPVAPLVAPAKRSGNKRPVVACVPVNAMTFIFATGCPWASVPKDLPPKGTVSDYFRRWEQEGRLDRIRRALT